MTFEQAFSELKLGRRIYRVSWGESAWLSCYGSGLSEASVSDPIIVKTMVFAPRSVRMPTGTAEISGSQYSVVFLPSFEDLFAKDWLIYMD